MYNYKSLMSNVLSTILSWCECERKQIEYDPETIEVLKAIYRETDPYNVPEDTADEETDSEDSDYEPPSDIDNDESTEESSEEEESEDELVGEELIVRKDIKNGLFWLF
jgi:hypothetical protein